MDALVRQYLASQSDSQEVTTNVHATYFGTPVDGRSLTPGAKPRLGVTRFRDWLAGAAAEETTS